MTKLPRVTATAVALLAILIFSAPAFAGDPPSRVLRLGYMSGQVSFQPGGVDDWVAATINRPLTTADRVWTDKDSKAELTLGTAALRMDSETSMTLSNVSDNTVQVELDQGVLNVHVRRLFDGEIYEVDTPNIAFTLTKPGDYRFEVDPIADTTTVIVRKGKGEANGNGRGVEVRSGEMARFEHGNSLMHSMANAPRRDGFDDWCDVRSDRLDRGQSARYVSDDVIGYEDLDDYGSWRPVPTYGYVWYPRTVVVGWAPYRYGHWAWIDPWGWTWVDDAPWGFAPFHYGRWVYSSYGWGWCPGPRHYRPIYAPALVAWFGVPHWNVGISFGGGYGVGWVPLGWGEPYYPYYHVSRNYVREVNIRNTHITNINYVTNNYTTIINNRGGNTTINHYANVGHGATTIPGGALEHGRPVPREMVRLNERDLQQARFTPGADVAPRRGAVLGGRENAPAALPPSAGRDRHVVTKMTPPARPDRFENRQPYIERNHGMPVDSETVARMKREGPAVTTPNRDNAAGQPGNGDRGRPMANPTGQPMNADRGRPMGNQVDRPANTDRPTNANSGMPANDGRREVPRPPQRDQRVVNLEGSPENAAKGNVDNARPSSPVREANSSNEGRPQHYVPRPPSDRRPASAEEGNPATNVVKGNASEPRTISRPPEDARGNAPSNSNSGRSAVFDRKDNVNQGRQEAEASTPRNVPRPTESAPARQADPGTFNRRNSEPAVNRSAPDTAERRSVPQPSVERRSAPEIRSAPTPKQERQSSPPAEKQKTEPTKKSSTLYNETPRTAESRSYSVPRPGNSYTARTNYVPRPDSSYTPRSNFVPRPSESYSARYADTNTQRYNNNYSPRYSTRDYSYSQRDNSYSSPSYSPRSNSYSRSYERSAPSYSRPSYSRPSYSSPSYSRSSGYSGGGGSRSYSRSSGGSSPRVSGGGGSRSYSSHASSGSHSGRVR